MGNFLRDINVVKKTITKDTLINIAEILEEKEDSLNKAYARGYCFISFIIRYDNKGYKIFSVEELLKHFKRANNIERLVFKLDVSSSVSAAMSNGDAVEVWLSNTNNEVSYLKVESDNQDWVNLTFMAINEVLKQNKSSYSWVHGKWVQFAVQVSGVVIIFMLSLILSHYSSPFLKLENSSLFVFFFAFLIFSNAWTYVNPLILLLLERIFPNIYFKREDRTDINIYVQTLISASFIGLIGSFSLYILNLITPYLTSILK